MKFLIDKQFDFDYGHRVWTQVLEHKVYSVDEACVCRHLHGHRAKVQVFLEGDSLNPQGMVTDFKNLSWLKRDLDKYVDHRFILDVNDPLFFTMTLGNVMLTDVFLGNSLAGREFVMHGNVKPEIRELLEGYLVVDFVPTSENLAKWLFGIVQGNMQVIGINCARVDWWETPKSRSSYRE